MALILSQKSLFQVQKSGLFDRARPDTTSRTPCRIFDKDGCSRRQQNIDRQIPGRQSPALFAQTTMRRGLRVAGCFPLLRTRAPPAAKDGTAVAYSSLSYHILIRTSLSESPETARKRGPKINSFTERRTSMSQLVSRPTGGVITDVEQKPLITAILVTRNKESYIRECLCGLM